MRNYPNGTDEIEPRTQRLRVSDLNCLKRGTAWYCVYLVTFLREKESTASISSTA